MEFDFCKYQATGNDFIMIDGRKYPLHLNAEEIALMCHRRFGIGADGVIILKEHPDLDFEMDYYNADGSQSFCGNGSRCAQAFAREIGMVKEQSKFLAIDGQHLGQKEGALYATKMADVGEDRIEQRGKDYIIQTGSPHYLIFCDDADAVDVGQEGRKIRYSEEFRAEGINVNFISPYKGGLKVRTYERGVEDETYSCGTGVTAAAIAHLLANAPEDKNVEIHTKGGQINIRLEENRKKYFENIWLVGPALKVFEALYQK